MLTVRSTQDCTTLHIYDEIDLDSDKIWMLQWDIIEKSAIRELVIPRNKVIVDPFPAVEEFLKKLRDKGHYFVSARNNHAKCDKFLAQNKKFPSTKICIDLNDTSSSCTHGLMYSSSRVIN